ncbi:hypothetical protein DL98DRAFT_434306, partial [Cadophora sp. DSE1049]
EIQALSQLSKPFKSITIDFIIDLIPYKSSTISKVFDNLLVIINRYTKETEYIPYLKMINVPLLAKLFIDS